MKNGLYALAALDGAPLDPAVADAIFAGLSTEPVRGASFAAIARDPRPDAAARHDEGSCADLFLGSLDEADGLRRRLGLPAHANNARIAGAAQDRWGVEAARTLGGEWTLLRWDGRAGTLVLLLSECLRDSCYYAVSEGRVAVAPTLVRLAGLDGVNGDFDPDGLVRTMGRHPLERSLGDHTFVKGVRRLPPGTQVTIRADGRATETLPAPVVPEARAISFEAAVQEVEVLLRQIVRRRLAGAGDAAIMLSGGLDSSLVAWLASEERAPGQRLHFLSSAAPEGTGVPDETGWAAIVADHLGVPVTPVTPGPDADVYAPGARMLAGREGPILSPRHYLYEAFEQAALARGAQVLFDGVYGELTVTNPGFAEAADASWRRRLAHGLKAFLPRPAGDADPLHVRLAPHLRRQIPRLAAGAEAPGRKRPGATDAFGYAVGWEKSALPPTNMGDPAVRYALPFRDRSLLALFASLPAGFAGQAGVPRAIGRAILKGRLPDRIVARTSKMPFSPTYPHLLARQAGAARERLVAQRAAGAAEWLDLDWLDRSLAAVESGGVSATRALFRIQATAMAAEFFRWWRDQGLKGR